MSDKAASPEAAPAKEPSPAPAPAETEEATDSKPESTAKPTSSKKTARPAKPRTSTAGGSKKAGNGNAGGSGEKSFSVGDIVLARLKGYPPWPARIADPETLPNQVAKGRQGKNSSTYCCHFFPAGDYSWLNVKEISALPSSDIKAYLKQEHRKAGELKTAYETADDPTEWIENQERLAEERAKKDAGEDVDQLEDDDEAGGSGGKRKRAEPAKKSHKKKKVEKKTASEVPESEDEAPKSKSKQTAKKSKPAATPKNAKKADSKAAPAEEKADDDPLASDPECVKVKDWRHRLQRAFLGKGLPTSEDMGTYDALFKTIEEYEGITIDALQYSKIGKVMKKIATLEGIPRNDELRITDRASKLMHDWSGFISKNDGNANGNGDSAPKTNGESSEKKEEATNGDGGNMDVDVEV